MQGGRGKRIIKKNSNKKTKIELGLSYAKLNTAETSYPLAGNYWVSHKKAYLFAANLINIIFSLQVLEGRFEDYNGFQIILWDLSNFVEL